MLTWVCPTCGKELDVATRECPACAGPAAPAAPAPGRALSDRRFWLLLAAGAVLGVVVVVMVARYQSRPRPRAAVELEPAATLETLPAPARPARDPAADIEIAGIRAFYDAQNQPRVRAIVINHGEDVLHGVTLAVSLRAREAAAGSPPLARFDVKIERSIGSGESQEIQAALETFGTLAALPSWQRLRGDVELR